jgi:hypothetical protein
MFRKENIRSEQDVSGGDVIAINNSEQNSIQMSSCIIWLGKCGFLGKI